MTKFSTDCPDCGKSYPINKGHRATDCIAELVALRGALVDRNDMARRTAELESENETLRAEVARHKPLAENAKDYVNALEMDEPEDSEFMRVTLNQLINATARWYEEAAR